MNLFDLIKAELKALFTNPVVMLTVFGGVVFYSFLYRCHTAIKRRASKKSVWLT
ncbi:ABC-type multidrug transport system permease component [Vibrio ponticus]|nr:ABC-type multidrug transport system permease component [Vibrio ponticus]